MSEDRSVSRRGFLRAATGATAAGATAAGASGAAAAQEDGGGGSTTVELVNYEFVPGTGEPMYITPGTTVTFVWVTSTHNIVVDGQPEGAGWEGHQPIEDAGFEYEHTFTELGEYEYHCQPHLSQGMEATIVVNEQGAPPQQGGGEPAIPDSAKTLGIATSVAMGATLALAYAFLKYGGGGPTERAE